MLVNVCPYYRVEFDIPSHSEASRPPIWHSHRCHLTTTWSVRLRHIGVLDCLPRTKHATSFCSCMARAIPVCKVPSWNIVRKVVAVGCCCCGESGLELAGAPSSRHPCLAGINIRQGRSHSPPNRTITMLGIRMRVMWDADGAMGNNNTNQGVYPTVKLLKNPSCLAKRAHSTAKPHSCSIIYTQSHRKMLPTPVSS